MNKTVLAVLVAIAIMGSFSLDPVFGATVTENNITKDSLKYREIISSQIERSNNNFQFTPSELYTPAFWDRVLESKMNSIIE